MSRDAWRAAAAAIRVETCAHSKLLSMEWREGEVVEGEGGGGGGEGGRGERHHVELLVHSSLMCSSPTLQEATAHSASYERWYSRIRRACSRNSPQNSQFSPSSPSLTIKAMRAAATS